VKRIITFAVVTTGLILGTGAAASSKDLVEIRLRGYYYTEPATVQITVAVEPDPDNRALIIEADSDGYFRSSALTLSGDRDKRLHTVEFKNLPAGSYTLRAQLRSNSDVLATATQDLFVNGLGGR
jgi:hypothetical protein